MRSKKRFYISLILPLVLFGALLAVSGYMVVSELVTAKREADAFDRLADEVRDLREMTRPSYVPSVDGTVPFDTEPPEMVTADDGTEVLFAYASLYEQNPDYFGWLLIEGTTVDYPVMFTPSYPEKYLRRAFDGTYAVSGTPFLDGAYFDGCYNYLIYGHNMKNGKLFADTMNYANESYWRAHPIIQFDTLDEFGDYEVMAAFYSEAYPQDAVDVFRYYRYIDLSSEERYNEYIAEVEKAALYDTGVTAEYGDQLLTLSTCSYHSDNGRFVVVARKIS